MVLEEFSKTRTANTFGNGTSQHTLSCPAVSSILQLECVNQETAEAGSNLVIWAVP